MRSDLAPPEVYTVGQLCRTFGVSPRAVRLYEDKGILPAQRDHLNRRLFTPEARNDLAVIVCLRAAGISLAEIGLLLRQRDSAPARRRHVERLLRARQASLRAELDAVEAARRRFDSADLFPVRRPRVPYAV